MGRKIFVSYKYSDSDVFPLTAQTNSLTTTMARAAFPGIMSTPFGLASYTQTNVGARSDIQYRQSLLEQAVRGITTTVRSYVDKLEAYFDRNDIYKGESNDEDISHLSDSTIWEKLKDKIYDSSVTIVMISKGMRDIYLADRSQWIPWEISYSLKEMARGGRTSRSNAMIAIVLPDINNSYRYFIEETLLGVVYNTDILFAILRNNISYIQPVKWDIFIQSPQFYINKSIERQQNIYQYSIMKEV